MKRGQKDSHIVISRQAIKRLPYYLKYLKKCCLDNIDCISASTIASDLKFYEVVVRKDLSLVSSVAGRPRIGFQVDNLIADIEHFLGYDNVDQAILIGAGHLGKALMSYRGFDDYGLEIVAAFDIDESVIGSEVNGKKIFHIDKLESITRRIGVCIGIIAVPADTANEVCDKLVSAGMLAIWNFAPTRLSVPENVLVQNENMAASLAILSKHLSSKRLQSPGRSIDVEFVIERGESLADPDETIQSGRLVLTSRRRGGGFVV
ncbi:MAG: redox-sensing transcriptional repressor Rex [Synergistaceae bacterium]|jgi:redox-sensing transcriptional repressor|nr:redox-sensing transcriptional repressor Rex [Synergistaceae bacterium]